MQALLTLACVRHMRAGSVVSLEPPAVEGTLDAVLHHAAHYAQIGTEVGAVGVHHSSRAVFGPERDQLESCNADSQTELSGQCSTASKFCVATGWQLSFTRRVPEWPRM